MKGFNNQRITTFILGLSSLVFMWLLWVISTNIIKNEYVLPSFSSVINAFIGLAKDGFFYLALYKTILKVVLSFIISFLLAGVFSTLSYIFKPFGSFFKPFLSVIRTLPTMAILVIILLYATSFVAPIIVAILVMFPLIFSQISVALDGVDEGLINAMKIYKLSTKTKIFKVYIPLVLPHVCYNVGSNLSFCVKLIISAEVMAYTFTSIGGLMQSANGVMDIAKLMALTLIAVFLGLIIELVCHLIFKNLFSWNRKGDE